MQGAWALACEKRSLTLGSSNSYKHFYKIRTTDTKEGTPASPAIALASKVFPVPGGPTKRIPLGMRAPSLVNF